MRLSDMLHSEVRYALSTNVSSPYPRISSQMPISLWHPLGRSVDLRHPWGKVARTNENVSTYLGIAFVNEECIMIDGSGGDSGCRLRRQLDEMCASSTQTEGNGRSKDFVAQRRPQIQHSAESLAKKWPRKRGCFRNDVETNVPGLYPS